MKNLLFTLAGIATFALAGCDNDDDDVVTYIQPAASRTELITEPDWVMTSSVQTANGQTVDLLATQPATAQDDVFTFEENGDAAREEGATREAGASDVVDTGTWVFMNEEQNLKVDLQSLPVNDQIVELTNTRLVIRNFDGVSESVTTLLHVKTKRFFIIIKIKF